MGSPGVCHLVSTFPPIVGGVQAATADLCRELLGSGADVLVTERGSTFGYNELVVDMRGLVAMREFAPSEARNVSRYQWASSLEGTPSLRSTQMNKSPGYG